MQAPTLQDFGDQMTPSDRALAASIRQTLRSAYGVVVELEQIMLNSGGIAEEDLEEYAEELAGPEDTLARYVEKLFRDTKLLAERLGAPATAADIGRLTPSHAEASSTDMSDEGDLSSRHLQRVAGYFESLEALTDGKDVTGLGILETMLHSTPKIIKAFKLEPKNEADVQKAMATAFRFAFPDVIPEVSIGKNFKMYKPDFGIRSLHAAVEYKFIDSEQEAKTALDGTFADMKGYAGTFDWRHFYAVYYMTDAFLTQREVDTAYKLVRAEENWTPIVVFGKGARKDKALKAKPLVRRNSIERLRRSDA